MENRHLFRGKTDDERWVYGAALWHDNGLVTIFNQHPADGSLQGFEVDSDTVCQCLGMTDNKNSLSLKRISLNLYHHQKNLKNAFYGGITKCNA